MAYRLIVAEGESRWVKGGSGAYQRDYDDEDEILLVNENTGKLDRRRLRRRDRVYHYWNYQPYLGRGGPQNSEPPRSLTIRCRGCECGVGRGYGMDCGAQPKGSCTNCPEMAVAGDIMCPIHRGSVWNYRVLNRWRRAERQVARGIGGLLDVGKERKAEMKRAAEAAKLGTPRRIDPGEALLEEIARSQGHVDYLLKKCQELEESELVWQRVQEIAEQQEGLDENSSSFRKLTETHAHEINKWWTLYYEERKHLVETSATTLRAGVDERRVRVAERTSLAISAVAEAIARDLGHDPSDPEVAAIIGTRFRELLAVDDPKPSTVPAEYAGPGSVIDGNPSPVDF